MMRDRNLLKLVNIDKPGEYIPEQEQEQLEKMPSTRQAFEKLFLEYKDFPDHVVTTMEGENVKYLGKDLTV